MVAFGRPELVHEAPAAERDVASPEPAPNPATKSDELRRGLQALERQLSDPGAHPALRIAGILEASHGETTDAAREHDRVLAEAEESSWAGREGG